MAGLHLPPFHQNVELISDATPANSGTYAIPNEPFVNDSADSVHQFLHREVSCDILDELYPHLHFIARKSSSHVTALHYQVVKVRAITITENPGLHLVWYYKILFIKPIPHCLLNFAFWRRYLCPPDANGHLPNGTLCSPAALSPNCRAALGFLRTYAHLIRHESDFRIAKDAHLVPDHVTYAAFQAFIEPFRHITDEVVSLRYHYDQIRLARLNWAVRIFRPAAHGKMFPVYYRNLYIQTSQYLERFSAPLLFLFASLTLVLSSMQVVLAAGVRDSWASFYKASWGFSVAVIIFIVALCVCGFIAILINFISQLVLGIILQRQRTITSPEDSNP